MLQSSTAPLHKVWRSVRRGFAARPTALDAGDSRLASRSIGSASALPLCNGCAPIHEPGTIWTLRRHNPLGPCRADRFSPGMWELMQNQADCDGRPGALLGVAIALLKTPDKWAPGCLAETAQGTKTDPTDARAVRWGCMGALIRACAFRNISPRASAFRAAMACLLRAAGVTGQGRSILDWEKEPGRSHEDVLTTFRLAVALAHSRER